MAKRNSLHTVSGGGTRSEKAPPYNLLTFDGVRRTALRFGLGAEKHGADNWKRSCETEPHAFAWCVEAFNHMQEHARKMVLGLEPEDDHIGAIGWAVEILAYCEQKYGKRWTELKH